MLNASSPLCRVGARAEGSLFFPSMTASGVAASVRARVFIDGFDRVLAVMSVPPYYTMEQLRDMLSRTPSMPRSFVFLRNGTVSVLAVRSAPQRAMPARLSSCACACWCVAR
jgi:hypothetical protein